MHINDNVFEVVCLIVDVSSIKDISGATISVKLNNVISLPTGRLHGDNQVSLSGSITAANSGDHISILGDISTDITVECDRCLSDFLYHIETSVDDSFYDKVYLTSEQEENLREQGVPFRVYEDDRLDVLPSIVEALLLEFPIKLICNENCKGLCSVCGRNLNKDSCSCVNDDVDPRMLRLKELLEDREAGQ